MPYILNKTNGSIIATVQDAALDTTTDLTFLGKNYAGYGEVQNENFLKLLENFSNTSSPSKPIEGQLWFNSSSKKINVYDNTNWKGIASLEIASSSPAGTKNFTVGDLWFNNVSSQLYGYNGSEFVLVGPQTGDDVTANWRGSREFSTLEPNTPKYNIKAVIGDPAEVIAVVSHESYTIEPGTSSFPMWDGITGQQFIKKGITLVGSGSTGNSEAAGVYFWGSASHSLTSNTSTYSTGIVATSNTNTNAAYSVPFINATTTGSITYIDTDAAGVTYNPFAKTLSAVIFSGTATSAYYADLAERYAADNVYNVGTVVVIGGSKDITLTDIHADVSVAGIVSQHPAYMMNSAAGPDDTHPYVALRGRVPCKVIGPVKKGQLLVTSSEPGYAEAFANGDDPNAVLAKSLQNFNGVKGIIEVLV